MASSPRTTSTDPGVAAAPLVERSRAAFVAEVRRRFGTTVKMLEQPLLIAIAATAAILGFVGYRHQVAHAGLLDAIYAVIKMFRASSDVDMAKAPWSLRFARTMAPLVGGYAAIRATILLFRDRLDGFRVQLARNHAVIVGDTQAAAAVARTLAHTGRKVLLVDDGPNYEQAAPLRSGGVLTVKGDGRRPETLSQARVGWARDVLALMDDDAAAVDVALRSRDMARSRGRGSHVLASVSDAEMCELLRIETVSRNEASSIDFVNARELTARDVQRLLREHWTIETLLVDGPCADVIPLVARLVRSEADVQVRLRGLDASTIVDELDRRFGTSVRQRWVVDRHDLPLDEVGGVVMFGAGAATLRDALALARCLPAGALVVAVLPQPAHLRSIVAQGGSSRAVPVHLVDSLACWSDADLILGGSIEVIARATHDNYRATRRAAAAAGEAPDASDASMQPWHRLPSHLKKSNRAQARHVWTKLAAIGCAIAPATGGPEDRFEFSAAEVERLAMLEHERWNEERRSDGWRPGPRDPERKRTPYLVPWEQLTEEIRDLDRVTVVGLPSFLLDLGYRIVRPGPAAETSAPVP